MTCNVDTELKQNCSSDASQSSVAGNVSFTLRVHYHHLQSRVYNFQSKPSRLVDSELLASEGGIEQLWKC